MQDPVPVTPEKEWSLTTSICVIIGFASFVIGAVALMEMFTVRGPSLQEPHYASSAQKESK